MEMDVLLDTSAEKVAKYLLGEGKFINNYKYFQTRDYMNGGKIITMRRGTRETYKEWMEDLQPGQTLKEKYLKECEYNNRCSHLNTFGKLNMKPKEIIPIDDTVLGGLFTCKGCKKDFIITADSVTGAYPLDEINKACLVSRSMSEGNPARSLLYHYYKK